MKLLLLSLLCLILVPTTTFSQIFHSNGAIISVSNGAIVRINGGMELSGITSLTNNGQITITKQSTLPLAGTYKNDQNSTNTGNGQYNVEQDWINDGVFTAGNSTVTLNGNTQQFITSTNNTITQFNNLALTGTGTGNNRKKTLSLVSAKTGANGILTINDRELETQTNSFFVLNQSPAAILFTATPGSEGFVSSLSPGYLSRLTNSTSPYIFPTGSSSGTLRFRPVELTPQANIASEYLARLNNFDSNTQTFDRSQTDGNECTLNDLFFHSIERQSGNAATDVKLFYIPATDGNWNGIAHWVNSSTNWNDIAANTASTSGVFTTQTKSAWNFPTPGHPYILSTVRPEAPVLTCPTICANSDNNVFTLTGTTSNYQWTFPSNGTLVSGQGTNSILADWTTGVNNVSAVAVDANGCTSLPGTCAPTISPNPTVQFTYSEDGNTFSFDDQTSGATNWDWTFGDGGISISENPVHTYNGGDLYTVTLEVTNAVGCIGSGSQVIEIFHDIIIPNIITPNQDGNNDEFEIKTSGLKSYDLVIVNRWGNLVFSTTDPTKYWDGKINGTEVVDGVYFYTLKTSTTSKDLKFQGNVTVIKN